MHHASSELVRAAQPFLSGRTPTYASVLLACLFRVYGAECLTWDPLTIQSQVHDDFEVHMPEVVNDQLMALVSALTSDAVYTSIVAFDQTIEALNRDGVDNDQDMPTPEDLAWGVFELTMNDPAPRGTNDWPFSRDIALYCGVVLADAGFKRPPQTLEFATMPSWVPKDSVSAPDLFGAAFQSQEALAADIDREVSARFELLAEHLRLIGVEPAPVGQESADNLPEADPLAKLLPV